MSLVTGPGIGHVENVVTEVVLVMLYWKRRRRSRGRGGRIQKAVEGDITSSHLITILTACRDDPLAMNSSGRDS